jgi:uncharacterized protein (TIGR04255 family)
MPDQKYKRPPILEAIFELRISSALSERTLIRLRDRFQANYPAIEAVNNIEARFDGAKVDAAATLVGFRLTAKNAQDVLVLQQSSLTVARLAPYLGWDHLLQKTHENFAILQKTADRPVFSRIGVRYINRIDVPSQMIQDHNFEDFLLFGVSMPMSLVKTRGSHLVVVEFEETSVGAHVKVQTGQTPPALLDHESVLLDIEVSIERDIPLRTTDLWERVNMLRAAKNQVFENAITDRARQLFE